jgi:hypothetical protein
MDTKQTELLYAATGLLTAVGVIYFTVFAPKSYNNLKAVPMADLCKEIAGRIKYV